MLEQRKITIQLNYNFRLYSHSNEPNAEAVKKSWNSETTPNISSHWPEQLSQMSSPCRFKTYSKEVGDALRTTNANFVISTTINLCKAKFTTFLLWIFCTFESKQQNHLLTLFLVSISLNSILIMFEFLVVAICSNCNQWFCFFLMIRHDAMKADIILVLKEEKLAGFIFQTEDVSMLYLIKHWRMYICYFWKKYEKLNDCFLLLLIFTLVIIGN